MIGVRALFSAGSGGTGITLSPTGEFSLLTMQVILKVLVLQQEQV